MYKKKFVSVNGTATIFMRAFCNTRGDFHMEKTVKASTPQNGQTHSNNSSASAGELFEHV